MSKFFISVLGLKKWCFEYAVVNPYNTNYNESLNWLRKCADRVKEVLIDTAVHKLFNDLNLTDYPDWYLNRYLGFIKRVLYIRNLYGKDMRVMYVIPDIPVDYKGRESLYPFNVERTAYYIQLFLEKYVDRLRPAEPIAVIQGKKDDVGSVIGTYRRYRDLYDRFSIVGIGPTCHSKNYRKLYQILLAVENTVDKPYHAFGVHYSALKLFMKWKPSKFRSFDSTAFYYIGKRKVRTPAERMESLKIYMRKLADIGVEVPRIWEVGK